MGGEEGGRGEPVPEGGVGWEGGGKHEREEEGWGEGRGRGAHVSRAACSARSPRCRTWATRGGGDDENDGDDDDGDADDDEENSKKRDLNTAANTRISELQFIPQMPFSSRRGGLPRKHLAGPTATTRHVRKRFAIWDIRLRVRARVQSLVPSP